MSAAPGSARRVSGGRDTPPAGPTPVAPWGLATASLAPIALIGGWTLAAPPGFDPVSQTISALAATDAARPAVMTTGLVLTGLAHLGTATALRPLGTAGRALLAVGGLGTLAVAALPVDTAGRWHTLAAAIAFIALSLWPAAGLRRGCPVPPCRAPFALGATTVLVALFGWFYLTLAGVLPEDLTGLSERVLAGAQVLTPLAAVLLARRGGSGRSTASDPAA